MGWVPAGPALTAISAISASGAGRRASCHGPQDPYEVRLSCSLYQGIATCFGKHPIPFVPHHPALSYSPARALAWSRFLPPSPAYQPLQPCCSASLQLIFPLLFSWPSKLFPRSSSGHLLHSTWRISSRTIQRTPKCSVLQPCSFCFVALTLTRCAVCLVCSLIIGVPTETPGPAAGLPLCTRPPEH